MHICALIISDCNGKKIVKVGQQKPTTDIGKWHSYWEHCTLEYS